MSLSETRLKRKQKQYWTRLTRFALVFALIGVLVSAFILFLRAIVVEIRPDEASFIAERELSGMGIAFADRVYLIGDEALLTVSATGFIAQKITLNKTMGERNITVTLEEAAASLEATAAVENVALKETDILWSIDGDFVAVGSKFVMQINPGEYALAVSHPYYATQTLPLILERGENRSITLTLQPIHGEAKISSEPSNAAVMLNGELVGKTPLVLNKKGGSYDLKISSDGFVTIDDALEITADKPRMVRNYQLVRKKARVAFSFEPADGQLLVNGKIVPTDSAVEIRPLQDITMVYSKEGYFPRTIKRRFSPGELATISFSLEPEFGRVVVTSIPESLVTLNGKAVGLTPQDLSLRSVPHELVLSKKGYRSAIVKFQPISKRVTRIDTVLKTELQARLEKSPQKMINSIGMELILFDPRKARMPVILGAPRSEKGHRANELLREVIMTKPFYVSSKEISVGQYNRFSQTGGSGNLPVTNIGWNEAARFCNWLSNQEGFQAFYIVAGGRIIGFDASASGYRLPSEAEWEWLARYANRAEKSKFVWGNAMVIPKRFANLGDKSAKTAGVKFFIPNYNDGYARLAPIGSLTQDAAGLHDMAGNVSEWVHDVYFLDIRQGVLTNPLGRQRGDEHVVKGSSWRSGTLSSLRSSFREGLVGKRDDLGFRIARYVYAEERNE